MKTRYELNIYSVVEFQNLERHLEKMATKGWMLKSMGQFFIKYEKQKRKACLCRHIVEFLFAFYIGELLHLE